MFQPSLIPSPSPFLSLSLYLSIDLSIYLSSYLSLSFFLPLSLSPSPLTLLLSTLHLMRQTLLLTGKCFNHPLSLPPLPFSLSIFLFLFPSLSLYLRRPSLFFSLHVLRHAPLLTRNCSYPSLIPPPSLSLSFSHPLIPYLLP